MELYSNLFRSHSLIVTVVTPKLEKYLESCSESTIETICKKQLTALSPSLFFWKHSITDVWKCFKNFSEYYNFAKLKSELWIIAGKLLVNPFFPNAPFLYHLKTSANLTIFWCFQAAKKGCNGNELVNLCSDWKKKYCIEI